MKIFFPELFPIFCCKEALAIDHLQISDNVPQSNVTLLDQPRTGSGGVVLFIIRQFLPFQVEKRWSGQKLLDPNPKRGTFEAVFLQHGQSTSWLSIPLEEYLQKYGALEGSFFCLGDSVWEDFNAG